MAFPTVSDVTETSVLNSPQEEFDRPVAKTEALIPEPAQIDMVALARNAEMLRQIERIVAEYAEQQEDEELLLLALIH